MELEHLLENQVVPPQEETPEDRWDQVVAPTQRLWPGETASFRMANNAFSQFTEEDIKNIQEIEKSFAKGALIAPFTWAPDTIGIASKILNVSQEIALDRAQRAYGYGKRENLIRFPEEFSGDPIRELVGLDPHDIHGMIGEMFGNWENAFVKGGTFAVKAFNLAMAQADGPGTILALIIGARGLKGRAHLPLSEAKARLRRGEDPATIMYETGWYKDVRDGGIWKKVISDKEAVMNTDAIKTSLEAKALKPGESTTLNFRITDVFRHDELYKRYPQIKDFKVTLHVKLSKNKNFVTGEHQYLLYSDADPTTMGHLSARDRRITVFNQTKDTDGKVLSDWGRSTILHEIQHIIQKIEGFTEGTSPEKFREAARNIVDARTSMRMMEDVSAGRLRPDMTEEESFEYLVNHLTADEIELAMQQSEVGLKAVEEVKKRAQLALNRMDDLDAGTWDASLAYDRAVHDATILLRLGNESPADFMDWVDKAEVGQIFARVMERYLVQGGEVEARIVQFLRDKSQEELRRYFLAKGASNVDPAMAYMSSPVNPEAVVIDKFNLR